jgi:homogentisate 1,2-dioxygenase
VRPTYQGSMDEGLRTLTVKRYGALHAFTLAASPLDAVGFDGTVYPWAFPIARFRPRVGLVHLPPDVHLTFRARGVAISSFVPRPLDFHPDAVPCPYPHSSVDCDEVIFYAGGAFLSRRGIERGSLTLHPAGIPHGPAPGAYEASIGRAHADETAVMLDTDAPLVRAEAAERAEDLGYHARYCEAPP